MSSTQLANSTKQQQRHRRMHPHHLFWHRHPAMFFGPSRFLWFSIAPSRRSPGCTIRGLAVPPRSAMTAAAAITHGSGRGLPLASESGTERSFDEPAPAQAGRFPRTEELERLREVGRNAEETVSFIVLLSAFEGLTDWWKNRSAGCRGHYRHMMGALQHLKEVRPHALVCRRD